MKFTYVLALPELFLTLKNLFVIHGIKELNLPNMKVNSKRGIIFSLGKIVAQKIADALPTDMQKQINAASKIFMQNLKNTNVYFILLNISSPPFTT